MMNKPRRQPATAELKDEALIKMGRETFDQEAETLRAVGASLSGEFAGAVRALFECSGRVLVTGLGKSGIVARKLAATLTSTGTPSHFIHPVEAAHGDLGVVRGADILIAISRSGNNDEVVALLQRCHQFGMTTMAITGGEKSHLAVAADFVLHTPVAREACPLNLTPTSSAVAAMAMGDALVTSLIRLRGFEAADFAIFHPSGTLGRSLVMKVDELMHTGDELPVVLDSLTLRESLPEIVDKRLGGVCVVDQDGRLVGLVVDGDVKRVLLENDNALDLSITKAMNDRPTTIKPQMLAIEALRMMEQRKRGPVTLLIAVDDDQRPVGLLHIHDVLRAGLL
ncbi:MAG: KpsF/GutQ family sugar-phosphate isomerase [Candidatus Krumholzibacteria bacterium]|nr:KpsF/GutQ family sugar-phosphate isomerase [Candidatus Krumholzibacteria bacterium]